MTEKNSTYSEEVQRTDHSAIIKWLKQNILLVVTMTAVILGMSLGLGLRKLEPSERAISLIAYPGELYMRILKLLVLPLIISSLITGSSSVNAKLNGKIALRTLLIFFTMSTFSALLGVILGVVVHPGDAGLHITVNKAADETKGISALDSLLDLGRNILTDNIFQATFEQARTEYKNITVQFNDTAVSSKIQIMVKNIPGTNNIGIVFFCIIFGSLLGMTGPKGQVLKDFFSVLFDVVIKMVRGVIWITPVGLFSIIAAKIASIPDIVVVISQLGKFIATVLAGIILWQLVVLQLLYFIVLRQNPLKFYLALSQGTLTAFAASSSAAALPMNFEVLDNKLKLHPAVTRFVLPIGCQINLNGTALFLAVATIFMAQINGFYLGTGTLVTIWFSATMMSFSTASIPSASLVLLLMIMSSVGIPAEDFPLMFVIDWILDRFRTTNNVLGDCYTAAIVQKLSKKELAVSSSNQNPEENDLLLKEEQIQTV